MLRDYAERRARGLYVLSRRSEGYTHLGGYLFGSWPLRPARDGALASELFWTALPTMCLLRVRSATRRSRRAFSSRSCRSSPKRLHGQNTYIPGFRTWSRRLRVLTSSKAHSEADQDETRTARCGFRFADSRAKRAAATIQSRRSKYESIESAQLRAATAPFSFQRYAPQRIPRCAS